MLKNYFLNKSIKQTILLLKKIRGHNYHRKPLNVVLFNVRYSMYNI